MTEDKDIKQSLKLLDDILYYLIHNCTNYTASFDNLYEHLFNRKLSDDKDFNQLGFLKSIKESESKTLDELFSFSIADNTKAQGEKLVEACHFLHKKGLVRLSQNFDIKITYDGILKYSDGFLFNYQRTQSDSERLLFVEGTQLNQNQSMMDSNRKIARLTFWIMLGTVVAASYYLLLLLKALFPKLFYG